MKHLFFFSLLLCSLSTWCAAPQASDTLRIQSARITTYKAVQKDTAWVQGAVVARIYFVKFDWLGRKRVENMLNPDGSAHKKLLYIYGEDGRIKEQMEVLVKRNAVNIYGYDYDAKGKLTKITPMNADREPITAPEAKAKMIERFKQNPEQFVLHGEIETDDAKGASEAKDSTRLLLRSDRFPYEPIVSKMKRVDYTYNAFGHWVKRMEYQGATPQFIIHRELEYAGMETDWEQLQLSGKVKTVTQTSYVAIPKDPETIDRGKKQGVFFRYEFDEKGRRTVDASFSETGVPGKVKTFTHDAEGHVMKESLVLPDGKPEGTLLWKYSPEGDVKSKLLRDPTENVLQKGMFRYDAEGNCVHETWFQPDGSKFSEFHYAYDSYGQQGEKQVWVRPAVGESQQTEGETYCPVKRSWNFNGRIAEEWVTLPDGGQLRRGYTYSTKGRQIGGTEQLNDQPEVEYIYKFFNDEHGNWVKRIKFVGEVPVVYEERTYTYYE